MPDTHPISYNPNQLPTVINTVVALSASVRNIDLSFQALKTTFINAADLNSLSTNVTDLNTNVTNISTRVNAAFATLPSQHEYVALANKVTTFSTTLISAISTSINTDPLNALITAKLESSGTYTTAITSYLNTYGNIALQSDVSAATLQLNSSISTLSTAVAARYATQTTTGGLQTQINDLSLTRVRVSAFNALSTYIYSTITNSAELSNPAAITEEINRRVLNTTYVADLSNTTATINNISTNYAKLSDLSELSTFITNTFSTATITFSTISGLSANIGSTILGNFSTLSGSISSNVYTLNTSISTLSTAAATTYATLSGVSIIRQDLSSLSSYVNTLSGNIYGILGGNISGTLSTNISTLYSQISTANSGNISTFSTVFEDISQISSVQRDLSAHFLKYYTSSIVDGISGDLHTLYDNLQSDVEIIGSQIGIIQENILGSDITQIGIPDTKTSASSNILIPIPSDAQWMHINMKGGDGKSGDSYIKPLSVTGYIPVMPYDVIEFYGGDPASNIPNGGVYPTARSKLAGTIYDTSSSLYGSDFNGVARFFNGDTSYNATGAASGLVINGTLVVVAKGGKDEGNIHPAGGEPVVNDDESFYRNPYNYPTDSSQKYYKQILNLNLSGSAENDEKGKITYTFYKYTNPPQFSFKYAVDSAGNNGIDTTYVDEFANYIVGTELAPRRLLVNGLVDICGAIRNGTFYSDSVGKTTINTTAATPLQITNNLSGGSTSLYIDSSGAIQVNATDIKLNVATPISIADIPHIYATKVDLSNTSVSLGSVTGAFTVVTATSTIKAYDGTGTYQGYIRVGDNGKIVLNDVSATFNVPVWTTSGLNVVGNISGSAGLTIGGTTQFNNTVTVSGDISGLSGLTIAGQTILSNLNVNPSSNVIFNVSGDNTQYIITAGDLSQNYLYIKPHRTSPQNSIVIGGYNTTTRTPVNVCLQVRAVGNDNLVGGNVGIGTGTPEAKLDVAGTASIQGPLKVGNVDSAASSNILYFAGTDRDFINTISGNIKVTTAISERIYEAATEKSELLLFKGNDSSGTTAGPDRIRLVSTGGMIFQTLTDSIRYDISTGKISKSQENTYYDTDTSFNTAMYIDSSANIGIGTVSPQAKLDVAGTASIQGPLKVGNANSLTGNLIYFAGTAGDEVYNISSKTKASTVITERKYKTASESSELLLFKGNDTDSVSGDRIRIIASSGILIQTAHNNTSLAYDICENKLSGWNDNIYYDNDASFATVINTNFKGNVGIGGTASIEDNNLLTIYGNTIGNYIISKQPLATGLIILSDNYTIRDIILGTYSISNISGYFYSSISLSGMNVLVTLTAVGGGGGGAGASRGNAGGGGGSGQEITNMFILSVNDILNVTCGSAGSGGNGASDGSSGNDGGNTSIKLNSGTTLLYAIRGFGGNNQNGGIGYYGGAGGDSNNTKGTGGDSLIYYSTRKGDNYTSGSLNADGPNGPSTGGATAITSGNNKGGGGGASSAFGIGGNGNLQTGQYDNGWSGTGYGSGGGGAGNNSYYTESFSSGGNGAPGCVKFMITAL